MNPLRLHFPADALLTDIPVLAVHATEIAPAEEYGAGAVAPAEHVFFAMVRAIAMHERTFTGPAYGSLYRAQSVHATVAGAEVTVFQVPPCIGRTSREFTRLGQFEITGLHENL